MRGSSLIVTCLVVVLLAFGSILSPFTAEARHSKHIKKKNCHHHGRRPPVSTPQAPTPAPITAPDEGIPPYQAHGCGYTCSDSNDCTDSPCTVCCADQTCCYDEQPFIIVSPPLPSVAPIPSVEAPTPPPYVGIEIPPYETHGCGDFCSDSNDCDWPCTICCANQTCCYDQPFITSPPWPSVAPLPRVEAPAPPPYETHGCGHRCSDSNDCDWPCTLCCPNQTCCHEEPFFPSPAEPILPPVLPPSPVAEAPEPSEGAGEPPYQIRGCGYKCSDSNDCDWPCTSCCANRTCCYEQPYVTYPLPPTPSYDMPIVPILPSPAPAPAPLSSGEDGDDYYTLAPPAPYYDIGVPADIPPPGYEYPPYQTHGCGYGPCMDSNDCDWPCTECCANHTCCHEQAWPPMY